MSYGIELYNQAGARVFDMATRGCLLVEQFAVPASGGAVVRTYSALAGRTLSVGPVRQSPTYGGNQAQDIGLASCAIDYALGYPRITASPGGQATTVTVFAR